jgi:hypothetical protein
MAAVVAGLEPVSFLLPALAARPCHPVADLAGVRPLPFADGLADAEQAPLAVAEPGGSLADAGRRLVPLHRGDAVHRAQAGDVDLFEDHPAAPQLGRHGVDVLDLHAIWVWVPDAAAVPLRYVGVLPTSRLGGLWRRTKESSRKLGRPPQPGGRP